MHNIFQSFQLNSELFAKNWDIFAILLNKLIGNVVQVNIKHIHIFYIEKNGYKYINNMKLCSTNKYNDLNYINLTQSYFVFKTYSGIIYIGYVYLNF